MRDDAFPGSTNLPGATRTSAPSLAVVVPCFNEVEVLPETLSRLRELLSRLAACGKITPESRIYCVDDGSVDETWALISRACEETAEDRIRVDGIKLSRNFGHQAAVLAGLMIAAEDVVISIDADLQDDLGAIERMIDAHARGAEIVYGVRAGRDSDTAFKRHTAELYYRLLKSLGVDVVFNHADYRLLSRPALEALRRHPEVNLFLRGIVPRLGYPSARVYYDRGERLAGESKYPLRRMLGLALDGVTSFSAAPLRAITVIGLVVSLFALATTAWALWTRFFTPGTVPGWASTVIPMYFLGGVQLLCIGIIGEYLSKIYMETKRRPRYIVETSTLATPPPRPVLLDGPLDWLVGTAPAAGGIGAPESREGQHHHGTADTQ